MYETPVELLFILCPGRDFFIFFQTKDQCVDELTGNLFKEVGLLNKPSPLTGSYNLFKLGSSLNKFTTASGKQDFIWALDCVELQTATLNVSLGKQHNLFVSWGGWMSVDEQPALPQFSSHQTMMYGCAQVDFCDNLFVFDAIHVNHLNAKCLFCFNQDNMTFWLNCLD
jgi:hypothetical protein